MEGICSVCGRPLRNHPFIGWQPPAQEAAQINQDDAAEADAQEADDAARAAHDP